MCRTNCDMFSITFFDIYTSPISDTHIRRFVSVTCVINVSVHHDFESVSLSGVLSWTIIHLDTLSPTCSSNNPCAQRITYKRTLFVLLQEGPLTVYITASVVSFYLTVSPSPDPLRAIGCLFSVGSSVTLRCPVVNWFLHSVEPRLSSACAAIIFPHPHFAREPTHAFILTRSQSSGRPPLSPVFRSTMVRCHPSHRSYPSTRLTMITGSLAPAGRDAAICC